MKRLALGLSFEDVVNELQIQPGSFYVNSFNEFGRSWQVNVMADARFRARVDDIRQLKVRNQRGEMTSFAFIPGVVPLVIATGAGAELRRTLGTAVFSGMLGATFGIFLTPVFYYVSTWFGDRKSPANRGGSGSVKHKVQRTAD